jgi:hypothetical protein
MGINTLYPFGHFCVVSDIETLVMIRLYDLHILRALLILFRIHSANQT